jgi:hypothetical protein
MREVTKTSSDSGPKLRRRIGFPSWSWAGWGGTVTYLNSLDRILSKKERLFLSENPHFDTGFWIKNEDGEFVSVAELSHLRGKVLPEVSPILHVKANVFQFRLKAYEEDGKRGIRVYDGRHLQSLGDMNICSPCFHDAEFRAGLPRREWHGIALFKKYYTYVMIIDLKGDSAEPVGSAWLNNPALISAPSSRRSFRLK